MPAHGPKGNPHNRSPKQNTNPAKLPNQAADAAKKAVSKPRVQKPAAARANRGRGNSASSR